MSRYLGRNISTTESDGDIGLAKVWISIDMLSIKWKYDLSDKIKPDFSKLWLYVYFCIDAPQWRLNNA